VGTEARITAVEDAVARTSANLDRLSEEMRVFRDEIRGESRAFKEEMRGEMRAFQDEMRASRREADKRWGELANKMGTLVEDIVAPGIPGLFHRLFGVLDPDSLVRARPRHKADHGSRREFDMVVWGGDYFLVTETRSRARPEDIQELLAVLPEVRHYFADAAGLKVVGALASFYVEPSLVRAAEREGLLVFGLGAGLLEPLNTADFKPREF
jgi:hypothetical protein